ncbi:DUF6702 family protein [Flavilitoribacter nigricans]|uniref:Uncharacterized protein n=1 Tax=Flavilitoribacter nigricans (strain ATCC 23147 / DSM 23189 / NBRC 102662 / NCIMB 1420 / SS-2) TaxID=1122177 RepID=A0A2D0N7U2_FLAN2|nr:DUF6702 family protein [Flavilitoribacter nigricans]PHN04466.1 hypothetical protein CRP01_20880 [Flavilitoribacter nigricans DSM 23189 = NBRC 102662]
MHTLLLLLSTAILAAVPLKPQITPDAEWHEFHLSKCLIEYNTRESAIQISLHIFIDDTEEALRRQGIDRLFICTEKEDESAEGHLEAYLTEHLRLEVDGQSLVPTFLGKEVTEDLMGMWCYLEITGVKSVRELTITNEILMDAFEDQKNLVNVIGPGNQKGMFLFEKGESKESLIWKS